MIRNFILLVTLFIGTAISAITAQTDMVSVGAGYSQQAFYNIGTGEVTTIANEAWDIAFSNLGAIDAGILVNEGATYGEEGLKVYLAPTEDWTDEITDVIQFSEAKPLYNADLDWSEGAFNTVKDPESPFDYGWGAYDPATHAVVGTKVYVIQKRDGTFMKFQVTDLTGGVYNFRYADLDGGNEETASVTKGEDSPAIIRFSFENKETIEIPHAYDLIFARYSQPLDPGDGNLIDYSVTGVLLAPGTEAVVADDVDVDTVNEEDYADDYTSNVNVIGHEWKFFDFSQGWVLDEDRAQFVKTRTGDVYKVVFYDFEGSATGTTTLGKEFVRMVSSTDVVSAELGIKVFPNPCVNYLTIDRPGTDVQVTIFDNNGRQVLSQNLLGNNERIDVAHLQSGIYNVLLSTEEGTAVERLVISGK